MAPDMRALEDASNGVLSSIPERIAHGQVFAGCRGTQSAIRRHKSKIAIRVHHTPADISASGNYLSGLVPRYRFALHHSPQLPED